MLKKEDSKNKVIAIKPQTIDNACKQTKNDCIIMLILSAPFISWSIFFSTIACYKIIIPVSKQM